jgi:hypothetical protein
MAETIFWKWKLMETSMTIHRNPSPVSTSSHFALCQVIEGLLSASRLLKTGEFPGIVASIPHTSALHAQNLAARSDPLECAKFYFHMYQAEVLISGRTFLTEPCVQIPQDT